MRGVREAASRRLGRKGVSLDERVVAAAADSKGFVKLVRGARLVSLTAFARAVAVMERTVAMGGDAEAADARKALGEVVRAHVRFARALDLARSPADRLVPAFCGAGSRVGEGEG